MALMVTEKKGKLIIGKKKYEIEAGELYAVSENEKMIYTVVNKNGNMFVVGYDANGKEKANREYKNCTAIKLFSAFNRAALVYKTSENNGNICYYQIQLRPDCYFDIIKAMHRTNKEGVPIDFVSEEKLIYPEYTDDAVNA